MEDMEYTSVFYSRIVELADPDYRDFQMKLTPGVPAAAFIGVRIPALRSLAARLQKEEPDQVALFLDALPHRYYDEDNLHGLLLCRQKDFHETIRRLDLFLPYVNNWATCDIMNPVSFKKAVAGRSTAGQGEKIPAEGDRLWPHILRWMESGAEFTVRFGIKMLMTYYLDEAFHPAYLERVADVRHEAYYVNMMRAWFFATALSKQEKSVMKVLRSGELDVWTQNKAIQKARESRLIGESLKEELQKLRR